MQQPFSFLPPARRHPRSAMVAPISIRMCRCLYLILLLALLPLPIGNAPLAAFAQETVAEQLAAAAPAHVAALFAKAQQDGNVRVLVELALPMAFGAEGDQLSSMAIAAQRAAIADQQARLLANLSSNAITPYAQFRTIPFLAVEVDAAALAQLQTRPEVRSLREDTLSAPTLASSTVVIGAPKVWANGYEGDGQMIAILDTGIDSSHPFFAGRIVQEACFSNVGGRGQGISLCPNGQPQQTGVGAADAKSVACLANGVELCDHGSHVAGIAAGNGEAFDGVARGAQIIAIQVFTRFADITICAPASACVRTYTSDQIRAMEYLLTLYETLDLPIAAVNMSLGGNKYDDQADCDETEAAYKAAIDNLRSRKIATIISSGNDSFVDGISAPACISSAVAVGASTDDDVVATFSNQDGMVDLMAPGVDIDSAIVGGGFESYNGTSMAAPHVTGAWALLKSIQPQATVDELLALLQRSGHAIQDTRPGGITVTPRIQLDVATAMPEVATITPDAGDPGSTIQVTITATDTHFIDGLTTADFGAAITVNRITVTGSTAAVVEIAIAPSAVPGVRRVALTTGNEVVSKADGFTVNTGGPAPTISTIEPDSGDPGQTIQVRISATNTHFIAGKTSADFGAGTTVDAVTVTAANLLTVTLTVDADADAGERTVRLTTGAEEVEQPHGFRVNITIPPTGNATLYYDPAPLTMTVSDTRTIAVVVSPGNTPLNGLMIHGQVDPSHLRLLDVRHDDSHLGETLEALTFDATTGIFRFGAGVLGSTIPEPFTVISLTVEALAPTDEAGTPLIFLTTEPATDIAGPSPTGSVMEEARNSMVLIMAQGGSATLEAKVDLQGRASTAGTDWVLPLTVEVLTAANVAPLSFAVTTDEQGRFTLTDLPTGTYSLRVKGDHTLGNQVNNVSLQPGLNQLFLGTLREGDVETNTSRNRTVLRDFGQLSGSFNRCNGEAGYLPNADLNEQDDCVTIADFALLSANFNTQGWIVYASPEVVAAPLPLSKADALLSFGTATNEAAIGSTLTLPLFVDPRQGDAIAGVTLHLRFDPALVAVTAITLADEFPVVLAAPTVDPLAGTLRFSVATTLGQQVNHRTQIATIQLQLLGETDGTALTPITERPTDTAIAGASGSNILTTVEATTLRSTVSGNNAFQLYLPVVRQE